MLTLLVKLFVVTFEVQIRIPQDYYVRSGLSNSVQGLHTAQFDLRWARPLK